jgi:RNA polymerase sigma factor (sigma-70 family)
MSGVDKFILTEYIEAHKGQLKSRIARRIFDQQDVDDVLGDACVKAFTYIDNYDAARPIANWFSSILSNCIKDHRTKFLKEKASAGHNKAESFEEENFPTEDVNVQMDWNLLDKVKADITAKAGETRQVLELYFNRNYTPTEIAHFVSMNKHTIRNVVHRFKQEMRAKYE